MRTMPKKIDPKVKERCVRQVLEHLPEYSSVTAAAEVVARREGLGKETVRRWAVQARIDGGQRQGATSEELAEIKDLRAKVRRLEEDNEILRRGGCRTNRGLVRVFRGALGWSRGEESLRGLQLRVGRPRSAVVD